MKAQEIRETFLDFFVKKDHKIVKSSSLLPKDDPTLLFTNAGMNQFKNIFLGFEKRSYSRAVSVQKCMRVSGKHNDLEEVGRTNKHHTFFEMLGNFSFGDYFKKKAIDYAWELLTEVFKLDPKQLYVTVYEEDDEAFKIWNEDLGISAARIFRFGKEDNYWAMGDTGPCGPCSEIHYDLGFNIDKGDPKFLIGKGSDRFLELWNLVFMQFHQDGSGGLQPLPSPSIDTGMGLERLAAVLQKKKNNYESDLFYPLIEAVSDISGREYPSSVDSDISFRIIADHIRAVSFLISDGILPSNEGRGYVLRRLIRRAFRHGNALGIQEPFLYKLVGIVSDIMKDAYPEIISSVQFISKVCLSEEKRFFLTLSSGLRMFNQFTAETKKGKKRTIPGPKLFKLYDTYGFPLDLSKELAEEDNMDVDEAGFFKEMEKQRQRARFSWKGEALQKEKKIYDKLKGLSSQYVGYETDRIADARVLALLKNGQDAQVLQEGDSGEVFLDRTPFYAEAGGQIGDSGILKNPCFSASVDTAFSPIPGITAHKVKVISGKIRAGNEVEAAIDLIRRKAISKNHTATHLLHAALRQILGDHVKQSGSLVAPDRLRFDFTHFSVIDGSELSQIEALVNERIQDDVLVGTQETSLEEGLKSGATAIFEEKYGEKVRMVNVGSFSKELCGGVHVNRTGEIGLFKIISETSIAAGMRRIEAMTGEEALKHVQENDRLLTDIQKTLNISKRELLSHIEKIKDIVKEKDKDIKALRQKLAHLKYTKKENKIRKIQGISVLVQKVEGLTSAELRNLADSLMQKIRSGIVVLGCSTGDKAFLVSSVSRDLTSRIQANEFIQKVAPLIGGGGGGRPDFAQAGGVRVDHLGQALHESCTILEEMLSKA